MYSSSFDKFHIITASCQNICNVATTSKKVTMSTSTQNHVTSLSSHQSLSAWKDGVDHEEGLLS